VAGLAGMGSAGKHTYHGDVQQRHELWRQFGFADTNCELAIANSVSVIFFASGSFSLMARKG
jgi:hypothetical protein